MTASLFAAFRRHASTAPKSSATNSSFSTCGDRLDRACPGLDRDRPFSYRANNSRICSIDSITVLENSAFGLTRGFTCGLGVFEPSNEEAIALLKGEQEEAEVTVIDIEVEDEDTVEDEE